jgi:beta-glucuronidase
VGAVPQSIKGLKMLSPRWTASRAARRLDGLWDFAFDPDSRGVSEQWWRVGLPGRRPMPVPASYDELVVDKRERDHVGDVWYQTDVVLPASEPGRRTVLRFDAATHRAEVWVGESRVGSHEGGYTPFEFDISQLVAGMESIRVTVRVDNRLTMRSIPPGIGEENEHGRRRQRYFHDFSNYAGLARSVWLLSMPSRHISDVTVRTDLDGGHGIVEYEIALAGQQDRTPPEAEHTNVVLRDASGQHVASSVETAGSLVVDRVRPWSPADPYLYQLEVRHDSGGHVDTYSLPVGIRTIRVDGPRLLLNGEPVYLRGFGMHEDAPWRGKGHDNVRMMRDFTLMQWIGANSFRTSHYPYAEEVLDLADRLGFLVIDETAAVGLNLALNTDRLPPGHDTRTFRAGAVDAGTLEVHLAAIRELIARDKNHPSVIMWSVANEPDTTEPASRPYFAALAELTRELDGSRPVGFANVGFATPDRDQVSDLFDVLLLNRYFGWYVDSGDLPLAERNLDAELRQWVERHRKPIVVTEFGADAVAGLHTLPADMWSEEFQCRLVSSYLDVFARIDEVVGEHVWNFADFATPEGTARVVGNRKGVFTRDRNPKQVAHLLRQRWHG